MADTVETLRADLDALRAEFNALRVEFDALKVDSVHLINTHKTELPEPLKTNLKAAGLQL